jgi:cytochrome c556
MKKLFGLALLFGCAVSGLAQAQTAAPVDVIVTRQAGYDLMASALGAVNLGLKANVEVKSFAGAGSAMAAWAKQIPSLFPPGSDKGSKPTKAKADIWTHWPEFEKGAADLAAASTKLAELAKANDTAGFTAQLKVVGGACGACHKAFRAE